MKGKNAIAIGVAIACASPFLATAKGTAADVGHWEVMTPLSVSESAPWLMGNRPHLGGEPSIPRPEMQTATAPVEVITPLSVDESAPWLTAEDKRTRAATVRIRVTSLPNPHTPWSPNESGAERYSDYVQTYAAHVESVEQARIAAAAPYVVEPVASGPLDAEIDRLLVGASDTPQAPRDPEPVALVSPALVDSRQSSVNSELALERIPPDLAGPEPAASVEQNLQPIGEAGMPSDHAAAGANTLAAAPEASDVVAEPPTGATGGETQSEVEVSVPMQ